MPHMFHKIVMFPAVVATTLAGCSRLAQLDEANQRSKVSAANPAPAPAAAPAANPDEAVEAASESAVLTGSFLTGVGPAADAPAEPGLVLYGIGFFFTEGGAKLDVEVSELGVEVLASGEPTTEALALADGIFATLSPAPPKSPWVAHFRVPERLVRRITEVRVHSRLGAVAVERTITQPNFAPRADAAANISAAAPVAFAPLLGVATLEALPAVVSLEETAATTEAGAEAPSMPSPSESTDPTTPADPAEASVPDPSGPAEPAVPPSTPSPNPEPQTPDPTPNPDPSPPASPPSPGPGPEPGLPVLTLFVTEASFLGNLGGRVGADISCATEGLLVDSSVEWQALLSTTTKDARDSFADPSVEMVTIGGAVVNEAGNNVFDHGFLPHKMNLSSGLSADAATTFSGSSQNGYKNLNDCLDWTTSDAFAFAGGGHPYNGGASSFQALSSPCSTNYHLLCFGYVPQP